MPDTGWILPAPGTVEVWDADSGTATSNVGNITSYNGSVYSTLSVTTQNGQGKAVLFDWIDPQDYPVNAFVTGIEIEWAVHYSSTGQSVDVCTYNLVVGGRQIDGGYAIGGPDPGTGNIPYKSGAPVNIGSPIVFGGPGQLFGLPANTLVSDFFDYRSSYYGAHTYFRHYAAEKDYGGSRNVTIRHAVSRIKIYWDTPPNIDIEADIDTTISLGSTIAVENVQDIAGTIDTAHEIVPGNITGLLGLVSQIDATIDIAASISDIDFIDNEAFVDTSILIEPPTLERWGRIDAQADTAHSVNAILHRARNMAATIETRFEVFPGLIRRVDLQTDAEAVWIHHEITAAAPDGTIPLAVEIPITHAFAAADLVVGWSLSALISYGHNLADALPIDRVIDLNANVAHSFDISTSLNQETDLDATVQCAFSLTAAVLEARDFPPNTERVIVVEPRSREVIVGRRERTIVISSQQRNN